MAFCLICSVDVAVGTLCRQHVESVAQCSDITAEQVVSGCPDKPQGWLIDQWGHTHALAALTLVGRSGEECAVSILHHSVSALHGQLELVAGGWRLLDRGSLNGTYVNDQRIREARLHSGDRITFGDVSFFFSAGALPSVQPKPGTGRTVPSRNRDIAFSATLRDGESQIELHQRAAGGIARSGNTTSLEFARLEFALLVILAQRKLETPDPELCFVSSHELAEKLDFKSRDADGENVRELVRRVRRKLKAEGLDGLIESRQGVGYRLAWDIEQSAAS